MGGDANPGPSYPDDPYDTKGLDASSFLYQYGHTQQPGTSETSRFSYDFINNPNTINQIINIGNRAGFCETAPDGTTLITNHILKDGSDSVGIHAAVLRVYINIGSEGDYWADRLWNPATGTSQRPFSIEEVRLAAGLVEPKDDAARARKADLLARYPELGAGVEGNRKEGSVRRELPGVVHSVRSCLDQRPRRQPQIHHQGRQPARRGNRSSPRTVRAAIRTSSPSIPWRRNRTKRDTSPSSCLPTNSFRPTPCRTTCAIRLIIRGSDQRRPEPGDQCHRR